MREQVDVGLYWGQNSFCVMETKKGIPSKMVHVPIDISTGAGQEQLISEDFQQSSILQKAFRDEKILSKKVNISLPSKDLIYRTFVIPFMGTDEVRSVVEFEATKYIPIRIEDLFFSYHPVQFTEKNQKKIRVLFFAIRKRILRKYTGLLERVGLTPGYIEPAPVSLARALYKNEFISNKDSTLIVEVGQNGGNIIVVDPDVVQFVRVFQTNVKASEIDLITARLFNDIRVSANFYKRQNINGKFDKIVTVSTFDLKDFPKDLSLEFNKPVTSVNAAQVVRQEKIKDIGLLSAYGTCLRDRGVSTKNFDFSFESAPKQESVKFSVKSISEYKSVIVTSLVCSIIIFLNIVLSNKMVEGHRQKFSDLTTKEGIYQSSTSDDIEELSKGKADQLISYKNIRTDSNMTYYLAKIPQVLPKGMWLSSFGLSYYDVAIPSEDGSEKQILSKLSVSLEGYVYDENINEQFGIVNGFVINLKNDENFSEDFNNINLETLRQDSIQEYNVTYFKIVCK